MMGKKGLRNVDRLAVGLGLAVHLFSVVQTVVSREVIFLHAPVEEGFQICSIMVSSFGG